MFKPSLKNNWSLIMLALLSLVLYGIAQISFKDIKAPWYEEKLQASELMSQYMKVLKQESLSKGFIIDTMNDPNMTGLIGLNVSTITTSPGKLSDRLTTLNPNFAAVMIDQLKKAKLQEGDYVAVGLTGANPGVNLALYAAMSVLKLKPVIITSVGSSTYGANREDFTWLDMEAVLKANNLINFSTQYASIGGSNDLGRGLPLEGRDNLVAAMARNKVEIIEGNSLEDNIKLRWDLYRKVLPEKKYYKLFINVGAGIANVGSLVNAKLIHTGLNYRLADKEFNSPGVLMHFAKKNKVILHIYDIEKLVKKYELPINPNPLPPVGTGNVFVEHVNNIFVASVCLGLLLLAIIIVIIFDRHDRHFMSNIVDPDEEL